MRGIRKGLRARKFLTRDHNASLAALKSKQGPKNQALGVMAQVSLVLLLIAILISRWGRIAASTHGITAVNEQWAVEAIAHQVPPPFTHSYTAWQVMPSVYRIDWSEWHPGCKYLDFPSWVAFTFAGIFPAVLAIKLVIQRLASESWQTESLKRSCRLDDFAR